MRAILNKDAQEGQRDVVVNCVGFHVFSVAERRCYEKKIRCCWREASWWGRHERTSKTRGSYSRTSEAAVYGLRLQDPSLIDAVEHSEAGILPLVRYLHPSLLEG